MFDVFTAYTDLHEPVEEMEKFRHEMFDVFTAYTGVHVLSPQSPSRYDEPRCAVTLRHYYLLRWNKRKVENLKEWDRKYQHNCLMIGSQAPCITSSREVINQEPRGV